MVKNIKNLNAIFANMENINITIFEAKSQFCYIKIKILEFIFNLNSCYSDISKILKILD